MEIVPFTIKECLRLLNIGSSDALVSPYSWGPSNNYWIIGVPLASFSPLGLMFLLETFFLILTTLLLTILKTTWVALPMLISQLTLLEPFSYFTYGMINVPLLSRIIFSPLCPSSIVLGPPLLKLALWLRTRLNFRLIVGTHLGKVTSSEYFMKLLLRTIFPPLSPSSTILGPPLLRLALRLRTRLSFRLILGTHLSKVA